MRVAAHQPNFLPWLGQFARIASVDVFVFCDVTQYAKWTYHSRVQVKRNDTSLPVWLTVPVTRDSTFKPIRYARIHQETQGSPWYNRPLGQLNQFYFHAPWHRPILQWLAQQLQQDPVTFGPWQSLGQLNMHLVREICYNLGIATRFEVTSVPLDGHKAEVPIEIARLFGATEFVSGGGWRIYHDLQLWRRSGITPYELTFVHPTYPQQGRGDFIRGLSIIDALFNLGWEQTARLIREAANQLTPLEQLAQLQPVQQPTP